jgi:polysaccharide biosynthesis protein PslH
VDAEQQRWIVVADSPFLPAHGGGEREHLGFVQAALRTGRLALLVLPGGDTVDLAPYRALLNPDESDSGESRSRPAVLAVPRRTSPLLLAHPRLPYVVASRPAPSDLLTRVRDLAPQASGIVVFSYKSRLLGEALARGLGLPAVLRQHNREGAYHQALAAATPGARGWVLRREARLIERDERAVGRADWLTGTADISNEDAEWRRSSGAHQVVTVPSFALVPQPTGTRDPRPGRVLFIGSLDTATNQQALDWLLNLVWPLVRSARPDAVLHVVGRAPSQSLRRRLAAAGAALDADVADLGPALATAAVAVNPMQGGSGVNIKVVDYLGAAVPVVSTSQATRGLALRAGVDLEVSDDASGFAAAVLRLLDDPDAARDLAETGRDHLVQLLNPEAGLRAIDALLASDHQRRR